MGHSLQFVTYVCLERHPTNTECQPGSQTILQLSLVRTRHLLYKNRGEELLEHLPRSLHLHVKERLCSNSCLGLPSIPLVRELPLLIHWGSSGLLITGPLLLDHRTVTYSILESPYRRDKQVQNATGAKTPMWVFSHLWHFVTLWTVAHQGLLYVRFSRQEHWSGLPFPPSGNLPDPGMEPPLPVSPALQTNSSPPETPEKPQHWQSSCKDHPLLLWNPWHYPTFWTLRGLDD